MEVNFICVAAKLARNLIVIYRDILILTNVFRNFIFSLPEVLYVLTSFTVKNRNSTVELNYSVQ